MNQQDRIINNQYLIIDGINDIKEKLDDHDKKLGQLDEVKVISNKNKKKTKDGFSVSMHYAFRCSLVVHTVIHDTSHIYLII